LNIDLPADIRDIIVYLNGDFLPLRDARVCVLDRGFIFGDGVYEVIPVYHRKPFRLEQHLARLQYSLDAIRLDNPHSGANWTKLILALIDRCPHPDQSLYLQVTRGVAKRDHAFPEATSPTVFMMTNLLSTPSAALVEQGGAAVTAVDNRWLRCDIKTTSLLGNVLMRQLAADAQANETIMLRDGRLTEGSASNVFVVRGGVLVSPPKSHLILSGTTYGVVLELARKADMPVEIRDVTEAELRAADEIWITSASREVLAICKLDGKEVGSGSPGPVFRRMYALFQGFKADLQGKTVHA
jgi:D-alanine transaminase